MSCNKHKGSGQLFAVKQVKLPSAATNREAFERQVACVLRDVEVNYPFDTETPPPYSLARSHYLRCTGSFFYFGSKFIFTKVGITY